MPGTAAEKIALADLDSGVAQNVVGRRQVEKEIREREMQEIVRARHLHLVGAEREHDLAVRAGVDRLGVETSEEIERLANAGLQFFERGLIILVGRRLHAGEPRGSDLGVVTEGLNLARKRQHIRTQPHRQIDRRIDFARRGVCGRLVNEAEKRVEADVIDADAGLMNGKGHGEAFPRKVASLKREGAQLAQNAGRVQRAALSASNKTLRRKRAASRTAVEIAPGAALAAAV